MTTQSPDDDENDLGDRELVSLYMKYPELNMVFEEAPSQQDSEQSSNLLSSPTTSTTWASGSTTRTTPLRLHADDLLGPPDPVYEELQRVLRSSRLPNKVAVHFTNLSNRIIQISGLLFRPHGVVNTPEIVQEVSGHCKILTNTLEYVCHDIEERVTSVNYIMTRAPFTVQPKTDDLLSNYRQKAELIIEHVTIPTHIQMKLLKAFALFYDALVYNPALVANRTLEIDPNPLVDLNGLYNLVMTVCGRYREWCNAMLRLKREHMMPLVARINDNDAVKKTIREAERASMAADLVTRNMSAAGRQTVDDRVLEELRMKERRRALRTSTAKKTNFRRQVTV